MVTNGQPSNIAHSLSDINYVNDFTISFWMKLRGDLDIDIYSLLSQRYTPTSLNFFLFRFYLILIWFIRSGCYLGDFWDLRYYPQQYITFELYSSEAFNARADLRFYTDSIPFMDNWHRISLFVLFFLLFFYICFSCVLPLFYFRFTFGKLFCLFLMWQRYCDYPTWVQHSHARERDAA